MKLPLYILRLKFRLHILSQNCSFINMKKQILFLCLVTLQLFSANAQQKPGIFFDSVLQKYSANNFSGVLLVAENGKAVYHKAVGYSEFAGKKKLKETDIFELASVSKQFTAMIIMMLKEKGKLNYDDALEKYIDIPYKGISIRNLLTHTSGLPDYQDIMDKYWDKTKVAGNADCIAYLNKYAPPKRSEPGTKYEYSNTGYLMLASVAEKVSGEDFIELCNKWIFFKLKMNSTAIRTLAEKAATPNFAIGHYYIKNRQEYVRADSFPSSDYTIWLGNRKGPGRISSTAADLLKWDKALYTNQLVQQSTLAEAFTPMTLKDGTVSNYGFGWQTRNDSIMGKVVSHTGDNPGYQTQIIRYIDKNKTIILLHNNPYPAYSDFSDIIGAATVFIKNRKE
jgi:CubicO group peptidase (beta-lactamase class C family)